MFDSRNYAGNPTKGIFLELGGMQYGGFLGGDVDYVSGLLDLRCYQPLTPRQHFLFYHLTTLQTGELGKDIPAYRGFWLGGANTVRGYELGRQRGKNQTLFSLEYRYLLLPSRAVPLFIYNWYIDLGMQPVVGADVGTSWNDELGENSWLNGFILGVQILIPYVQMARFELGFGPLMDLEKLSVQFHMSAFDKSEGQRFRRR
jgi:outer membrane protein assembly factor BamA